jgi:hypothetical protein
MDAASSSDVILAVFKTPEDARRAIRRLNERLPEARLIDVVPLGPGYYRLADINRAVEVRAAVRGGALGAPIGAALGLGLATLLAGVGPFAAAGATAAGTLAGIVAGSVRGSLRGRIHLTQHGGLAVMEVPPDSTFTVAIVDTGAMQDVRQRAQLERVLARDGVVALIDPNHYFAIQRERAGAPAL